MLSNSFLFNKNCESFINTTQSGIPQKFFSPLFCSTVLQPPQQSTLEKIPQSLMFKDLTRGNSTTPSTPKIYPQQSNIVNNNNAALNESQIQHLNPSISQNYIGNSSNSSTIFEDSNFLADGSRKKRGRPKKDR